MNKFNQTKLTVILILGFLLSGIAAAHSGRTNAAGCHNNKKTGGYHCHNSKPTYSVPTSTATTQSNPEAKPLPTGQAGITLEVQTLLNQLAYSAGSEDGVSGQSTQTAIAQFQKDYGLSVTGLEDISLLKILRSKVIKDDSFQCGSKRYCTQMSNCSEAYSYMNTCGLGRLDGDNDGVPCEALCR